MRKAFCYLRVSGKGQLKGDGFARQQLACETYARGNDVKIEGVFREKGVSGANELDNRPALMEMLEALAADGVKLVLIEKLDRLARDLLVQETIIGDLRKRGFELISALEPDLLKDDPGRKLMRQVFGAIAEYDKAMIVSKLRGARERVRARGERCEGQKPYGHYDGEPAILARMRQLRSEGLTYRHVAHQINVEGLPTRSRGRWHAMAVHRILKRNLQANRTLCPISSEQTASWKSLSVLQLACA
jgi:DNA invertase Pin-like site-specific DNA recombinase